MDKYKDEITLKDILITISDYKQYIWEKKINIISICFVFFLFGIFLSFLDETRYKAEVTFVVEGENRGNKAGVLGIASQLGLDIGRTSSSTFSQSNILELFKSRVVIDRALMRQAKVNSKDDLIIEHYIEINEMRDSWMGDESLESIAFNGDLSFIHDSISGIIWKDIINSQLTVELESTDANIIKLSYISLDDEFAKEFSVKLIDEMIKMYTSNKTAQANQTLNFLRNRADSIFLELENAEREFARVKDINTRIIKASGRLLELQLMRDVEVLSTMYLEIIKNLELSKITLLNQTPIINIIDSPILPLEEYNELRISAILLGFLGGFLSICYFIFKKLFEDSITES
tara:strand:- start:22350 stop:23390 length:1041 start_codon:yes stop_codon:yes gene_type:complete